VKLTPCSLKREARGLAVAREGRLGAFVEELRYFVSPFKTPAYRWLWIQVFMPASRA
jgi:hypothetical protein